MIPTYAKGQTVLCFNCDRPITGPFQSSGHAPGRGEWRGQCTASGTIATTGCGMVTYFDLLPVCSNCDQWQRPPLFDCVHECAKRGLAPYGEPVKP